MEYDKLASRGTEVGHAEKSPGDGGIRGSHVTGKGHITNQAWTFYCSKPIRDEAFMVRGRVGCCDLRGVLDSASRSILEYPYSLCVCAPIKARQVNVWRFRPCSHHGHEVMSIIQGKGGRPRAGPLQNWRPAPKKTMLEARAGRGITPASRCAAATVF